VCEEEEMEDCAQEEGTLDVDIVSILVPLRLMVKREVKGHGQLNTPVIPYFTTVRLRRSGGRIPPPFAETKNDISDFSSASDSQIHVAAILNFAWSIEAGTDIG
jgi:hypothetical protein